MRLPILALFERSLRIESRAFTTYAKRLGLAAVVLLNTNPYPVIIATSDFVQFCTLHVHPVISPGKNSGPPSMEEWCEKLGVKATDEERMAMLQLVKAKSFEKKDLLTEDEFKAIVERVLQKAPV